MIAYPQATSAVLALMVTLARARAAEHESGALEAAEARPTEASETVAGQPVVAADPSRPTPLPRALPDGRLPPLSGLELHARNPDSRPHPLRLTLDLSVSYLRLAVHGDYRAGLAPFLGTSTTALGGFRLRF